jgi:hypothetical protein
VSHSKEQLESHMSSVHPNMKPIKYKCDHCEYVSSYKGTLKIHVKGLHLNKKYLQCPRCDFSTSWPNSLRNHVKRIHAQVTLASN